MEVAGPLGTPLGLAQRKRASPRGEAGTSGFLSVSPLRGLEGVPGLPGAPQDEAGLTRKFETSHVGGASGRTPPIPRSALEKDPRPGPLFEGPGMGEPGGLPSMGSHRVGHQVSALTSASA